MISVENLSKGFGPQVLFEEASFKINSGERVGLVGRNGHGKTTLFRMIVGEERPDEGRIVVPKGYRISFVRQTLVFTEATVLAEGMTALPANERDHAWKVEKILSGLGFSLPDMHRPPSEFSGGYQVRLNLAKALASEPDLLLLDEPTNYLDIAAIRWVGRFLSTWPRELLLITHDRSFMDAVVTHTLGIHRKKVRKVAGDTGKYYAQIAQEEEIHEKTRVNDERRRKEIEQFISRFRAKARLANLVQSRVKTLQKMERRQRLESLQTLDFSFRAKPFAGRHVMTASRLSFGYDPGEPVIRDFSISIGPRQRICVMGKNGRGKTTLLRLLAGSLRPQAGEVRTNPQVVSGVFEQTHIATLVPSRTVEEEIMAAHPDVDRQTARNICGAMMFSGDDALKKISVLSGGEKSRVMLGRLLATPANLLLLDEPTNHLDMESCDALLGAIDSFDGALVLVTHNEMFLHALADRLVVFQKGDIQVFEGGYGPFLETVGWAEETARPGTRRYAEADAKTVRKELRRLRSEILTERGRVLNPLKRRVSEAEDEIDRKEKELADLQEKMQQAAEKSQGDRIADLSRSIHQCQGAIDRLFAQLETLSSEYEARRTEFDNRLSEAERELPL